jgi:hypothetical protein
MKMRPIHRPPREPEARYPHCRWSVFIDESAEATPYEQHPNLPRMQATQLANVSIEHPESEGEPGGWADYSGPFDPGFQLEDLSHRALLTVCQETAIQTHLLARSLLLNVEQRHGEEAARELGRRQWIGAAAIGGLRVKRALGLGDDAEAIAQLFELHPHFHPRSYLDFRVEQTSDTTVRLELDACAALEEANAHSWFAGLGAEPHAALDAIAWAANPKARCRAAQASGSRFAWEVVLDPSAEPKDEPTELKLGRISRGVDFELEQRRTLRP